MKRHALFVTLFSLCLFSLSCTKGAEPAKQTNTAPTVAAASPTPTPESKQEYKGMSILVGGISRDETYKDSLEEIKPSKPGNDFESVILKVTPSKDETIKIEENPGSGNILTTTDGKVVLKQPHLGADAQGNKYKAMSFTIVPGGGPAKEVGLIYQFELPKTVQLKTVQFDDFTVDLSKVASK